MESEGEMKALSKLRFDFEKRSIHFFVKIFISFVVIHCQKVCLMSVRYFEKHWSSGEYFLNIVNFRYAEQSEMSDLEVEISSYVRANDDFNTFDD